MISPILVLQRTASAASGAVPARFSAQTEEGITRLGSTDDGALVEPRGWHTISDSAGNPVGERGPGADPLTLTIRMTNGTRIESPAFQRWLASPDGRTVLGAGDPSAPEHPFELDYVLFRDGVAVLDSNSPNASALPAAGALLAPLDPESRFSISADGRVGIVGHAPTQRGSSWVLLLGPRGQLLFRHALPAGAEAIGLAHMGDALWVLVLEARGQAGGPKNGGAHGASGTGRRGRLLRVDEQGAEELATFDPVGSMEGAQELVGLESFGGGLVRGPDELVWIDASQGRATWRKRGRVRPAGPSAWAAWNSSVGPMIAFVHSDVRRASSQPEGVSGEDGRSIPNARAPRLEVLDAATGRSRGGIELERRGPLALLRLVTDGPRLEVDWIGVEEVFGWGR